MRNNSLLLLLSICGLTVLSGCDSSGAGGGGSAATLLIADPRGVGPFSVSVVDGVAYFGRGVIESGFEPWISDGTPGGTHILRDIVSGPEPIDQSAGVESFVPLDGRVYFFVDDQVNGEELWQTDGTEEGTELFADLESGPDGFDRTLLDASEERVFLSSPDSFNSGLSVLQFSEALGEVALTELIPDDRGVSSVENIGGVGYFFARPAIGGPEPLMSDGTIGGTRFLRDINPGVGGSASGFAGFPQAPRFVASGGFVYFFANDRIAGNELWRTNGTEAGTELFADLVPGPEGIPFAQFAASEERMFLMTLDGRDFTELWVVEASSDRGAESITELTPPGDEIDDLVNVDGVAYFVNDHPLLGREPWVSDGTPEGTVLLMDIHPGIRSSSVGSFTEFDGFVYFFADDGMGGSGLWRTDGTESGTVLFIDFMGGGGLAADEDRMYVFGDSLWVIESSSR